MSLKSIWEKNTPLKKTYEALIKDQKTDVLIIGAGMTGISCAEILAKEGFKIILLEAGLVGRNNSGRSTGNLYRCVDNTFSELLNEYEKDEIKEIFKSRDEAMRKIENTIQEYSLDCHYKRVPWVRYSLHPEMDEMLKGEYDIAKNLELDCEWVEARELDLLKGRCGIKCSSEAQLNPFLYIKELASKIEGLHCTIYEKSRVDEIKKENDNYIVSANGYKVESKYVIEATHTPIGFSILQTLISPYREYGIAMKLKKPLELNGIFWGHDQDNTMYSTRTYSESGKDYLIAVGMPHKVGQSSSALSFDGLISYLEKYFPCEKKLAYKWAGQHYRSADMLPYIGKRKDENFFVATGFSTSGLVYGVLAAMLIKNEILGIKKSDAKLYSPDRINPIKSSSKFFKENLNVMGQYVKDYLATNEAHGLKVESGVVIGGTLAEKVALYKDKQGKLHAHSAICPHLKCVVHWNQEEKSWDCPCHGSRFTARGKVIEGPSLKGLTAFDLEE